MAHLTAGCGSSDDNRAPAGLAGEGGVIGAGGGGEATGGRSTGGSSGEITGGSGGRVTGGSGGAETGGTGGEETGGSAGEQSAGAAGASSAGSAGAGAVGGEEKAGSGGEAGAAQGGSATAGAAGAALAGAGSAGTTSTAGEGGMAEAGAGGAPPDTGGSGGEAGAPEYCYEPVDTLPVPVTDTGSLFDDADDGNLFVSFGLDFTFTFYGVTYDGIHINTNGGLTFGEGSTAPLPMARVQHSPTIAVFWGDLNPTDAPDRAEQLVYQQCLDRFIITYQQIPDYYNPNVSDSATVTLFASGVIQIEYGEVGSEDLLVGILDGTHENDQHQSLETSYDYLSLGTGIILLDSAEDFTTHTGWLSNQTITYRPQ
jgi:hypothetical protein